MKYRPYVYLLCLFALLNFCWFQSNAQTPNNCGVTASILPAAHDSVVALYTLVPFTNTSINATSVKWLYDGIPSGITGDLWNYSVSTGVHTISLVAYNGNCSDTTTVVYFCAGTAHNVDSLLVANYGLVDTYENGTCIDNTPDGGFIMGGNGARASCGDKGLMVKLRDRGCIDWSKEITQSIDCSGINIKAVYASADSNYYVAADNGQSVLIKFDKNGNLAWSRRWGIQNLPNNLPSTTSMGIEKLSGDPAGNIYTVAGSLNWGWVVSKINPAGTIIWNKYYELNYYNPASTDPFDFASPSGIVWLNGALYVAGNAYKNSNKQFFNFLTRMNSTSGKTDWQYGYLNARTDTSTAMNFDHLTAYDSLLMVSGAGDGQFVTLVDPQGKVRKSINTKFSTTYSSRVTKAEADANGNIYLMQWTMRSLPLQPYYAYYSSFAKIDTALNKYWGMVYTTSNGYFADAALSKKKSFAAVGADIGYVTDGVFTSRDFRFIKIDTPVVSSDLNCNYNTLDYNLASPAINRIDFNWVNDSSLDLTLVPVNISVKDAYMQSRYSCPDFIDSCSFMKITGPVAMCSYADSYTYRLHRNRKCTLLPQWNLSPGITLVNQTDSTLTVKFAAFGIYSIGAVLKSCIPVADSLIINVKPKTSSLNIGNDTILCANTFITLHAGPAFMNYIWKDGSTDSVLKASQPGIYWVQVMDSCGNSLRDSIFINPFKLAISIGPDRTKCNMDTLHLNGPDGFVSYEWGGNYNLSSTNSKSVIVNPLVDTSYYLKAEKMPGCFAYDTVHISVKISRAIQLGQDISFCNGDSSILNAGTGFAQYQWGGGSTMQVVTVYSKGDYSIIGTTAAGCKSFDTLRVLNVWATPTLNLDHNPNLCTGSTRTLQPGNYSSYIWQDGSILPSFTISVPGNYYVTVTDNHECQGSDTVHISTLLPLPAKFLPADTALCSYDEIAVKSSQVFSSYLWSTGETGAVVTIKQAGTYWLQVTDQYTCTGKDSVTVLPKECMKGLYVPTAFSPNQDGKNDVFKPLIFGNVLHFEWTIYNRYGQAVFTTHDPAKGWDGSVKGVLQNSAGFLWQCRYQLEGEKMKFKSGAVVLVR